MKKKPFVRRQTTHFFKWAKELNRYSTKEWIRLANRHLKSTSLVIREMPITTTTRYHSTPTRVDKMKKTDHTKCLQGCEATGTLSHCWWEWKIVWPLWRAFGSFFKQLKIYLPYDSAIPPQTLTLHKKMKAYIHTETWCSNIHHGFIWNGQKQETTQMNPSRRMD